MDNWAEKIEQYLAGELSPEDKAAFAARLAEDPALKRRMQIAQQLDQAFDGAEVFALRKELQSIRALRQQKKVRRFPVWSYAAVAAAIAILVLLWVNPGGSGKSSEALFAENFGAYPMLISSRADSVSDTLGAALIAYENGDYAVAARHFAALDSADNIQPRFLRFYEAVSLLGAKDGAGAIAILQALDLPELDEAKQWYLALAYLQNGQPEASKETLKDIQTGRFAPQAAELLEVL
ncbi:MAG: hypothetical protein AAF206_15120 [Bacteroidota bacterium]